MNGKNYRAQKLPPRGVPASEPAPAPSEKRPPAPPGEVPFYELDYEQGPIPGVGRYVRSPQPLETPGPDPVRERFLQMRDIARQYRMPYIPAQRFFDRAVQRENARIFYRQAQFMADFTDDWAGYADFSAYFPNYQMLGYRQLRTYFTWRTRVRAGRVEKTGLSYAFLYLYELLHCIGAPDPAGGLEQLYAFWQAYRPLDPAVDKYVLRWLKDFHIYYPLGRSFEDFAREKGLLERYPELARDDEGFGFYAKLSTYDLKKSRFCTPETQQLLETCVLAVLDGLDAALEQAGLDLDEALYVPTKKTARWTPFKGALFCPWLHQPDRTVVLSRREVYLCREDVWSFSTALATRRGKTLVSFVMKRTEAAVRRAAGYRFALHAEESILDPELRRALSRLGIAPGALVDRLAAEAYRQATRVEVRVDEAALSRIRVDADATQQALTVEEALPGPISEPPLERTPDLHGLGRSPAAAPQNGSPTGLEPAPSAPLDFLESGAPAQTPDLHGPGPSPAAAPQNGAPTGLEPAPSAPLAVWDRGAPAQAPDLHELGPSPAAAPANAAETDPWQALYASLDPLERGALARAAGGEPVDRFAAENGLLPEVLAEGINEKALDRVGDSLLDEDLVLYEDYEAQVKEMFEQHGD